MDHYSYGIRDALAILTVPCWTLHISHIHAREESPLSSFREISCPISLRRRELSAGAMAAVPQRDKRREVTRQCRPVSWEVDVGLVVEGFTEIGSGARQPKTRWTQADQTVNRVFNAFRYCRGS